MPSPEQRVEDEIELLQTAFDAPTADDSGDRAGHHQWRHSWPPGSDGYECVHCGLVVSMTRYPQVRDGLCAEWPVLDERPGGEPEEDDDERD
jgi:hypothetical protein